MGLTKGSEGVESSQGIGKEPRVNNLVVCNKSQLVGGAQLQAEGEVADSQLEAHEAQWVEVGRSFARERFD